MKPAWLFESDTFDHNVKHIIEEAQRQGMRTEVVRCHEDCDYLGLYDMDDCVIVHGTLWFAKLVARESGWVPGVFGVTDKFSCHSYYPHFERYLLNEWHAWLPYGMLKKEKKLCYGMFGLDDAIFIRPDTGDKPFSGQLIYKENFDKDIENLGHATIRDDEIVLVSEPRNISAEWRFFVADHEVIAGSYYRLDGKKHIARNTDARALNLATEIASQDFQPERIWCLDICRTASGNYHLLEIGCLSCAGWYACEIEPIVREASRIALEKWNDVS